MDREILFRGISKETKAMVYGAYFSLHHNDHRTHIHHFIIPANTPIPKEKPIGEIQIEVDPATVGQFTGLVDKNGVKIFEGDVVESPCGEIGVVEYFEEDAMFIIDFPITQGHSSWTASFGDFDGEEMTVIGNIHDTPELAKEEAE